MLGHDEPPTEAKLDRLADFLTRCKGGRAMNLEEFDGFCSALIAGPELVPPSEYLPEVFGEESQFETMDEANHVLGSIMRHWNFIAATLQRGDPYMPILLEDANGVCHGNDWARGFMRGVGMRHEGWVELISDEEHFGSTIPAMMLCHEHDEDPALRPGPITPEKREEIIVGMAAGLVRAYRHFRRRHVGASVSREPRGNTKRAGRNDRCPCGSGKKYKRCCGGVTIH